LANPLWVFLFVFTFFTNTRRNESEIYFKTYFLFFGQTVTGLQLVTYVQLIAPAFASQFVLICTYL